MPRQGELRDAGSTWSEVPPDVPVVLNECSGCATRHVWVTALSTVATSLFNDDSSAVPSAWTGLLMVFDWSFLYMTRETGGPDRCRSALTP